MTDGLDNLFVEIFQQGLDNDIQSFFDVIFGFLSRCTNFYEGDINNNEQILLDCFKKWKYVDKNTELFQNSDTNTDCLDFSDINKRESTEIIYMSSNDTTSIDNINIPDDSVSKFNVHDPVYCREIEVSTTTDDDMEKDSLGTASSHCNTISPEKFKTGDSYNGAITDKYSWSQTITDLDIQIPLPSDITSSKNLNVTVESNHLKVKINTTSEPYVCGDLCWKCRPSDSMWCVSNGVLLIHLEKQQERWWEKLLTTDEALDIQKMDCSRPLDELSEDAQNLVQEMFWNEQQKRLGKPTTDVIRRSDLLKKSWNAEGSPFRGTPFDPSLVKFE